MKVISHKAKVMQRAKNAFNVTAKAYDKANRDVISTASNWKGFEGRTTHRRSGEVVVGAFRNITDLGNLGVSQTMTIGHFNAMYTWDGNGQTPVQDVYFGKRTRNDFIPGRRWTDRALLWVNLPQVYVDAF